MDPKTRAAHEDMYDQFDPLCYWQREDAIDKLIIHLPGFKKEQVKLSISDKGKLKISGERPLDSSKKTKFYKEVDVDKKCDTNAIQANLSNGVLHILMPKATLTSSKKSKHGGIDGTTQTNVVRSISAPRVWVVASNIVVVVAVLGALSAYAFYKYKLSSFVKD